LNGSRKKGAEINTLAKQMVARSIANDCSVVRSKTFLLRNTQCTTLAVWNRAHFTFSVLYSKNNLKLMDHTGHKTRKIHMIR